MQVHALKSGATFEIDMATEADANALAELLRASEYDVMQRGAWIITRPAKSAA